MNAAQSSKTLAVNAYSGLDGHLLFAKEPFVYDTNLSLSLSLTHTHTHTHKRIFFIDFYVV